MRAKPRLTLVLFCISTLNAAGCRSDGGNNGGGASLLDTYIELKNEEASLICACHSESSSELEDCIDEIWTFEGSRFYLIGSLESYMLYSRESFPRGEECLRQTYQRFRSTYDQSLTCGLPVAEEYVQCLRDEECGPDQDFCRNILYEEDLESSCLPPVWDLQETEAYDMELFINDCYF